MSLLGYEIVKTGRGGSISRIPRIKMPPTKIITPRYIRGSKLHSSDCRLALDKNVFPMDGKCEHGPYSEPEAPDSPDDLLMNSLATLDDYIYVERLQVQCKLPLSNPTTPTGNAPPTVADDRYLVRPPS